MKIEIAPNKFHTVSDKEVERSMKAYKLTKEQAIKMLLEDDGILINEEQERLSKIKVKHYEKSTKPTQKRTRKVKPDETKKAIIQYLESALANFEGIENLAITNEQKVIEFEFDGESFKLDLIKKRKSKE